MTIKHILLPLTGEPSSADAAVCGLALAKRLGAHIMAGCGRVGAALFYAGHGGISDGLRNVLRRNAECDLNARSWRANTLTPLSHQSNFPS